jgi:hypothetical protein
MDWFLNVVPIDKGVIKYGEMEGRSALSLSLSLSYTCPWSARAAAAACEVLYVAAVWIAIQIDLSCETAY